MGNDRPRAAGQSPPARLKGANDRTESPLRLSPKPTLTAPRLPSLPPETGANPTDTLTFPKPSLYG